MLKIENLRVKVNHKEIINDLQLDVKAGQIHALMGPNGCGKSTLVNALMSNSLYQKTGHIYFNNQDITNLTTDEISKLGIYLCVQNPPVIEGVSTAELLRTIVSKQPDYKLYNFIKELDSHVDTLNMNSEMIHRSINDGMSGGERKKNEILQMLTLKPKLIILDEIDSGVDVDSLKIITKAINDYHHQNPETSIIIITHYSHILKQIKPDFVHILSEGKIVKSGNIDIAYQIEQTGFTKNVTCAVKDLTANE